MYPAPFTSNNKRNDQKVKLIREPLLHFMVIGAAIYLLYGVFAETLPEADDKTIVVRDQGVRLLKIFRALI